LTNVAFHYSVIFWLILHTISAVSVILLEMLLENYHKIGFKIAVLAVVLFQIVAFATK
jgi:hypothetical protein